MKGNLLLQDERLDYLECKDLSLIQNKNGYTFTMDAVLLANFAKALPGERTIDLGTGSGVVPILMSAKTLAKELVGVELQERLADMAKRSVEYNGIGDRVKILCADMKNLCDYYPKESFDVCTSNPPYYRIDSVDKSNVSEKDVCRAEVSITLNEVVKTASEMLKFGGKLYMIIKADRTADLLCAMREYNVEPKRMVAVQPKADKDVDTILVEGKKGAKSGFKFEKPLIIYNADGTVTKEAREKYHQ